MKIMSITVSVCTPWCSFAFVTYKKCLLFGRCGHDNLGDHYFECGDLKLVLF